MDEPLAFILEKVKIEEVIQGYVDLKKRGSNYLGLCPFHLEKSPSFTVSPSKQIYKCFGCGRSGNAISFLIEKNNYDLAAALKELTQKFNLPEYNDDAGDLDDFDQDGIMAVAIRPVISNLNANIRSVVDLMRFDDTILDFCINHIKELDNRIRENTEILITNVRFFPTQTLQHLENIKQNESFSTKYNSMYNQGVVLLISYFTSTLKELFKESIKYWATHKVATLENVKTEIKLSVDELYSYNFNLVKSIGDMIIEKKSISFQDMQSTVREFQTYFGIKLERTKAMDNIIFAQAARHAVVHAISIADDKFMNQVRSACLRSIKIDINNNDEIKFSIDEINEIIISIRSFIEQLAKLIVDKTKEGQL